MPNSVIPNSWASHKTKFLSKNSFNGQLQGYVAQIDRMLSDSVDLTPINKKSGYFFIKTTLHATAYSSLTCICAVNEQTGDYAPAALYFPGAKRTENMSDIAKALAEVRAELGW